MPYHKTYKGDPHWITARYPGQCDGCKQPIRKGDRIFYYPKGGYTYCNTVSCGIEQYREFTANAEAEEFGGFSTW